MTVTIELVKDASPDTITVSGVSADTFADHPLHAMLSEAGFEAKAGQTQMVPAEDGVAVVAGLGADAPLIGAAAVGFAGAGITVTGP